MTLRDTYTRFLATPSSGALADNASLHYVTTTTSISDATAIIKHLSVQERLLKKTKEKVLSVIESSNGLSVDVETTIEFINGGGAYLPGLDDNFVADRTVTFPMVHMVHFDSSGKITQIRQYWDQGSLLKQVDVIGARSRNWPIRDSSEQIRLIASNAAAAQPEPSASSRPSTSASRGVDEVSISDRSRRSTNNAMNDPHASLDLFAPRQVDQEEHHSPGPSVPRAQSAKPPPREYSELFAGADAGSPSPSPQRIPGKAGSGKHYKANRLFEEGEDEHPVAPMSVKTSSKKYDHFTLGEGEETPKVRDTSRPSKHDQNRNRNDAHWDFDDFTTPDKSKPKTLPSAVRHFGWSDDEETSPVRRPIVHKARPDQDTHFDLDDNGTPEAQRDPAPTKGGRSNKGQGLYSNNVTDNEVDPAAARALSDITKNKSQTRSSMKTHWGVDADSPDSRGINIAGNGMGGRKGTEWSLFEDDPKPAKKENGGFSRSARGTAIKTEGDGMGGRKGADKSFWDF
ncbi:hypothetical protein ACET3X_006483 [Alternaria dauci]|uniref:NTF2-like protein n=1 Tax=Alternaria dauci TaxID=48095 RepID=A0ABR3UEP7_9PLEO